MNIYIANPKALYGLLALIPAIIVAIFQYFRFKSAITSFNNISKMHIIRRLIMRMVCFSAAYASIIFALLKASIKSGANVIISGKTGSGKTEMQKYLVGFIEENEKIIIMEDTLDTHLKEIYPNKDILSWQINTKLDKPILFNDLIKAGLRNNPNWIIISETRGSEAYSMLKSCLSGHHIITTIEHYHL